MRVLLSSVIPNIIRENKAKEQEKQTSFHAFKHQIRVTIVIYNPCLQP